MAKLSQSPIRKAILWCDPVGLDLLNLSVSTANTCFLKDTLKRTLNVNGGVTPMGRVQITGQTGLHVQNLLKMKKIAKVDKLRNNVKGSKGYAWDLGSIVFDKEEERKSKKDLDVIKSIP